MKEELLRIENGLLPVKNKKIILDLEISRGECVGIFPDSISDSDTILNFFRGTMDLKTGKAFIREEQTDSVMIHREISNRVAVLERKTNYSPELTVGDYLFALKGSLGLRERSEMKKRFKSQESLEMKELLCGEIDWKERIRDLSPIDYGRVFLFQCWLYDVDILVFSFLTEYLRADDIERFMEYSELLLQRGKAVYIQDQSYEFLFRYAGRIDILKKGLICYRLSEDEYEKEKLYTAASGVWKSAAPVTAGRGKIVLEMDQIRFHEQDEEPFSMQVRSGEIAVIRDNDYKTASRLVNTLAGGQRWKEGEIRINGKKVTPGILKSYLGKKTGIQTSVTSRKESTLFKNLTGLENLSLVLAPKAGKRVVRKKLEQNILQECSRWFPEEQMLKKTGEWSQKDYLILSYLKWYMLNPGILICFFPFNGLEYYLYDLVMEMMLMCLGKGMGILLLTGEASGISSRCNNKEFLNRLRIV